MTKRQMRLEQTQSIKDMAADDMQDAQTMRMKKFLIAQVFMREFIESKSQKISEKFG